MNLKPKKENDWTAFRILTPRSQPNRRKSKRIIPCSKACTFSIFGAGSKYLLRVLIRSSGCWRALCLFWLASCDYLGFGFPAVIWKLLSPSWLTVNLENRRPFLTLLVAVHKLKTFCGRRVDYRKREKDVCNIRHTWILAGPHGINSASFLSLMRWRLLWTLKVKKEIPLNLIIILEITLIIIETLKVKNDEQCHAF